MDKRLIEISIRLAPEGNLKGLRKVRLHLNVISKQRLAAADNKIICAKVEHQNKPE